MSKWCLDAGHGGSDPGAIGSILKEKDVTLTIVKKIGKLLAQNEEQVIYTRQTDTFVELEERAQFANFNKADYFISIHNNAFKNSESNGTETYVYSKMDESTFKLAESVQRELVKSIGRKDRGVKENNYKVLVKTTMPAILIEVAFITNPEEQALLNSDSFLDKVAVSIVKGLLQHTKPGVNPGKDLTLLVGKGQATTEQMIAYLKQVNPSPKLPNCTPEQLVEHFVNEGEQEGMRGDIAFAQALKETGNFTYGNIVLPEQNNYSGIGALNGNAQGNAATFETPQLGVRAQIQHLKAYANTEPLKNECVDPRFNLVRRGTSQYVEWLGATDNPNKTGWAFPGKGYGKEIIGILNKILDTEVKKVSWGEIQINKLKEAGLITESKEPNNMVTWAELAAVMNRLVDKVK